MHTRYWRSIESEQHQYKNALEYKEKYIEIKDSLAAAENRSTIEEMEAKYQNDTKSAAIALLKKDQEIQATALQRNKIIIAGGIVAFVAAIIIAVLLLNRFRLLNRTKRQMEMERMRNQIARDLHDDIGSTLSSINIISQLALKDDKGEIPTLSGQRFTFSTHSRPFRTDHGKYVGYRLVHTPGK